MDQVYKSNFKLRADVACDVVAGLIAGGPICGWDAGADGHTVAPGAHGARSQAYVLKLPLKIQYCAHIKMRLQIIP